MYKEHRPQPEQMTGERVPFGVRVQRRWERSALHAFLFEPRLNDRIEDAIIEVARDMDDEHLREHVEARLEEIHDWASLRHGYYRRRRLSSWLSRHKHVFLLMLLSGLAGWFISYILG